MFESQPQSLRDRVNQLSSQAIAANQPTQWFEQLYLASDGDPAQIPWAKLAPHPDIQKWLEQHSQPGNGRKALMVGCGLGDDAEDLQRRGWRVTGFDIAPSAIDWCRRRFSDSAVDYQVADLLAPPMDWQGQFDLVVECRNVQALPLSVRKQAIRSVAGLVAPGGTLLVVSRVCPTEDTPDGPPWPLSQAELNGFTQFGLVEQQRDIVTRSEDPLVFQGWVEYLRR